MQIGWTPLSISGQYSHLMILTVDRRFKILEKSGRKWNVITDISQILYQYLSSRPTEKLHTKSPTCSREEASLRNARSKCYSLATNCWSWGSPREAELFTGQMSGHVIHYSVSRWAESRVTAVYKTQLKEISCIKFCEVSGETGILIVCGSDGRVEVLKVGRNMSSLGYLWEDLDRLVVNKIVIANVCKDEISLVLAKGSFCIQLTLRILNGSKIEVIKPSIKNTGMTRIVGLECHHDKLVYVNQKSPIQICDTDKLTSGDCVNIDVSRDNFFCQGMAASHSGAVFACLDNISTFNDHLIVREPGRLVFWTLDSEESVQRRMVQRSSGDLALSADILECYRVLLSANHDTRSVNDLPVSVLWWHYRALLSKTSHSDSGIKELLSSRVMECEAQLRCDIAIKRIRDNKASQSHITASARFIKQFSKNADFLSEVETSCDKLPDSDWRCPISGEAEDETRPEVSVVISRGGHTWPRCVTSQRAVDDTRPGSCGWCKSLTLSTDSVRCCLCGGPVSR